MTHLYKVPLQNSDLFVREIDLDSYRIRYEIRDKITGSLMESPSYVPFTVNEQEQKIEFNGRFIAIGLVGIISHVLKS